MNVVYENVKKKKKVELEYLVYSYFAVTSFKQTQLAHRSASSRFSFAPRLVNSIFQAFLFLQAPGSDAVTQRLVVVLRSRSSKCRRGAEGIAALALLPRETL